jgi:phage terminase large subunit GpA-like protein
MKNYNKEYIKDTLKNNLVKIIKMGREQFNPPSNVSVADWSEKNIYLPPTDAAGGRYNLNNTPYLKEILNNFNSATVRKMSIRGAAQWGKTIATVAAIGYLIDNIPCKIIYMQPTDAAAKDFSLHKFEPVVNSSPSLSRKVSRKTLKRKDSIFTKRFNGGMIEIVSARSTSSTRRRTARVTIADDVDDIKIANIKEGDPLFRLEQRSMTYPDRLNVNISTPSVDGQSLIDNLYSISSQAEWYVNCPHCNHEQTLKEENITWEKETDMFGKVTKNKPETARYMCYTCGSLWNEGERKEAIRKGKWIHKYPEIQDHKGYHLPGIASTLITMEYIAKRIIDAGSDLHKLEALHNTVYGRSFTRVIAEEFEAIELYERREKINDKENPYVNLPNDILVLTMSADVQKGGATGEKRVEVKIMGWGVGKENWIVYYNSIIGSIVDDEVKNQLNELKQCKWYRRDGVPLEVKAFFIDAGYDSENVYAYTAGRFRENIYAIRGSSMYTAELLPRKISWVNKKQTALLVIGTQKGKAYLYNNLKEVVQPGHRYTHFNEDFCGTQYFKGLTSERAVLKQTGLQSYYVYERKTKRVGNEPIDLLNYCYAAQELVNPNYEVLKERLLKYAVQLKDKPDMFIEQPSIEQTETETTAPETAPVTRRSQPVRNFVGGWK